MQKSQSVSKFLAMELTANHNLFFPTLNACLNALAGILLFAGWIFIKKGDRQTHGKIMAAAFGVSAVFLASYLYYHFNYDAVKYQSQGWIRPVYFTILITHIILATLNLPFILRIVFLAYKKRFQEHARMARWVWPVWMYVSITGVLVYMMLYRWQ
jgi:putative membrane protein